ncbi:MAG: hypothetical protein QN178_03485 [Armatimonadota bacterium]|nr:hypothetical protein [Armatimonadota bacterium]
MTPLPRMRAVSRRMPRPRVADPERATVEALARLDLGGHVRGRRIAVTAGSRGIRDIVAVLRGTVAHLRALGAEPLVMAAMGSHGGGTGEGQRRVLEHLGITEAAVAAPISTRMEADVVGHTPGGLAAYCDCVAASCDGIVAVNRLKPHTAFDEPFGSGLMKMLAVGLGKVEGASQIHRQGPARLPSAIQSIAEVHINRGAVVAGVAVVENAYDETARIEAIPPGRLVARELELYRDAKALLPGLPVDELDVLIVDEMGKIYAGTGMDTNVIGRRMIAGLPEPPVPRIRRIVVLRLSPHSEGNAQGLGLADLTTQRLVDAMDRAVTYKNTITSTFLNRGAIPVTLPSDREAIAVALDTLGLADIRRAAVLRIPNTLHLDRVLASDSVIERLAGRPDVEIGPEVPWAFAGDGWLADL